MCSVSTINLILTKLPKDEFAIFYQSDIKVFDHQKKKITKEWIDKSFLINLAAQNTDSVLLWHKIFLFGEIGQIKPNRASYSHMLCFSKEKLDEDHTADVHHRGHMLWTRGMWVDACLFAVNSLKKKGITRIIDPFCGKGTILAAANHVGLHAIGIDISINCCETSRNLDSSLLFSSKKQRKKRLKSQKQKNNTTKSTI